MPAGDVRRDQMVGTLLRLLAQHPLHAYALCRSLSALGFDIGHPTSVYHRLHSLERRLLVSSTWEAVEAGPARRVYRVSDAGAEWLRTRVASP